MSSGREAYAAVKVKLNLAHFTAVSAAAYQRAVKVELGVAVIEDAVSLFHLAERWCHSGILQLKGNMLMSSAPDQWAGAETCFHEALQIAHRQEAKSLELHVATSGGEQNRRAEARDLLAPIYDWFTEGFDTADLKDAKAPLDELG